jgi:hypothetical protein
MKKSLLALAVCVLFFLGGWATRYLSSPRATLGETFPSRKHDTEISPPLLDRTIADGSFVLMLRSYLDSGNTEDAKYMLWVRENSDILTINQLLPTATSEARRSATNLLVGIAQHRVSTKFDYHGHLPKADSNSVAEVNFVLEQFRPPK